MERVVITVGETANLLGICKNSVYKAIREGGLPCIRVGKRVLVPVGRLSELLGADLRTNADQRVDNDAET